MDKFLQRGRVLIAFKRGLSECPVQQADFFRLLNCFFKVFLFEPLIQRIIKQQIFSYKNLMYVSFGCDDKFGWKS